MTFTQYKIQNMEITQQKQQNTMTITDFKRKPTFISLLKSIFSHILFPIIIFYHLNSLSSQWYRSLRIVTWCSLYAMTFHCICMKWRSLVFLHNFIFYSPVFFVFILFHFIFFIFFLFCYWVYKSFYTGFTITFARTFQSFICIFMICSSFCVTSN